MSKLSAVILASAFLFAVGSLPVHADGETSIRLDQRTIERGYTVTSSDGMLRIAIRPGALAEPSVIHQTVGSNPRGDPPTGYVFGSSEYRYDISQTAPAPLDRPVRISLAVTPTLRQRWLAYYDSRKSVWERVRTTDNGSLLMAETRFPSLQLAVVEKLNSFAVPRVSSVSVLVMENGTGRVLGERAARTARPIASITKLMTALVALETDPDWDAVLTVQKSDDRVGARLRVRPGEQLTVRDAFAAMLIGSANNAAVMVARSTGLPQAEFNGRMNTLATELGLSTAHFVEPTGLDPQNVASAYDVALLTAAAFSEAEIADMARTQEYVFTTGGTNRLHRIKTTNELLKRFDDTLEAKTGYLDEAGYSLTVRQPQPDGERAIIVVVLGNASSAARFQDAEMLLRAAQGRGLGSGG